MRSTLVGCAADTVLTFQAAGFILIFLICDNANNTDAGIYPVFFCRQPDAGIHHLLSYGACTARRRALICGLYASTGCLCCAWQALSPQRTQGIVVERADAWLLISDAFLSAIRSTF